MPAKPDKNFLIGAALMWSVLSGKQAGLCLESFTVIEQRERVTFLEVSGFRRGSLQYFQTSNVNFETAPSIVSLRSAIEVRFLSFGINGGLVSLSYNLLEHLEGHDCDVVSLPRIKTDTVVWQPSALSELEEGSPSLICQKSHMATMKWFTQSPTFSLPWPLKQHQITV